MFLFAARQIGRETAIHDPAVHLEVVSEGNSGDHHSSSAAWHRECSNSVRSTQFSSFGLLLRAWSKRSFWSLANLACSFVGMTIEPRLDIIGAALADPSRSRILCELMDGRAFTNKELAGAARVSPQTASAHLKQLEMAGLTSSLRSGRHVYHRIANSRVASALEGLAILSPTDHLFRNDRLCTDTRAARSCYNHIAGKLGVLMTDRLVALGVLQIRDESVSPGFRCQSFFNDIGVVMPPVGAEKPLARLCLDWTERRHHIAGPLATAIMQKSMDANWLERRRGSRALTVTADGLDAFGRWFGLRRDVLDCCKPG